MLNASNVFNCPLTVRLLIESNERFEFNYGASWLRKIDLEIRVPYPWTLKSAHAYITRVLSYVKVVPFENDGSMEEYVSDGETLIDNLLLALVELRKVEAIVEREDQSLTYIHPWELSDDDEWKGSIEDATIPRDEDFKLYITLPEINALSTYGKASVQFIPTDFNYTTYTD